MPPPDRDAMKELDGAVVAALELTENWPVESVTAVATVGTGPVCVVGEHHHVYRIASLAKPLVAWIALVAVEEGIISLDAPLGQPGCTVRHLLSHAGGYAFDGADPSARPGVRRIYSNTGIEMVAAAIGEAARMPFERYLREGLLEPLGMHATELRGSPAHDVWSTAEDMARFTHEVMRPTLVSPESAAAACTPQFPGLAGVVPGLGRYDPCPWGLGFEIRGDKSPHWTGTSNSRETFGHFGGAGTFLWVDPGAAGGRRVGCIALTDRPFDEWAAEALVVWPQLSDALIAAAEGG